jgi:signal transduction histidine kinase
MTDPIQQLEIRNRQLAALNQAAVAIAGELSLDKVLQQIVEAARDLIGAQYAALGVPDAAGYLETFIYSGLTADQAKQMDHLPRGLGLLGALIHEQRPVRIPRLSDDPRSVGFPPNHPPMASFLGVPIVAGSESLGNLYLTNKLSTPEFTADDQALVEMLAAHAAVAIQNARLYQQVGRLAIVEERTRIGMDLHDGIIQSIFAVGLTLESARLSLPEAATDSEQLLQRAIDSLNDTIRDIRNYILDLRPRHFQGDLSEGLGRLVREFQANTLVEVELVAPAKLLANLPTAVARTIFLSTQEALANVARHARAKAVKVVVKKVESAVHLTISDDGQGFDMSNQSRTVGHGLANMQARANELEGVFILESQLGRGTTITLQMPLTERPFS